MKTTTIVFSQTIPEIKFNEKNVEVDFGVVLLEISYMELESLLINLLCGLKKAGRVTPAIYQHGSKEGAT